MSETTTRYAIMEEINEIHKSDKKKYQKYLIIIGVLIILAIVYKVVF